MLHVTGWDMAEPCLYEIGHLWVAPKGIFVVSGKQPGYVHCVMYCWQHYVDQSLEKIPCLIVDSMEIWPSFCSSGIVFFQPCIQSTLWDFSWVLHNGQKWLLHWKQRFLHSYRLLPATCTVSTHANTDLWSIGLTYTSTFHVKSFDPHQEKSSNTVGPSTERYCSKYIHISLCSVLCAPLFQGANIVNIAAASFLLIVLQCAIHFAVSHSCLLPVLL